MNTVEGVFSVEYYYSGWRDQCRCLVDLEEKRVVEFGEVLSYNPDLIDEEDDWVFRFRVYVGDDEYVALDDDTLEEWGDDIEGLEAQVLEDDGAVGYLIFDMKAMADCWC